MCSYRKGGDEIYQVLKILYPENGSSKFLRIFYTFIKACMTPRFEVSSSEYIIIIHVSQARKKIKYLWRVFKR
jgi:hypothetical protein